MNKFKFDLGQGVKDVVTWYQGVVMARVEYLTGCNQYAITQTTLTKDGKRADWEYFDENRLIVSGKSISLPKQDKEIRGADGNYPDKI